jgi:hypothetical protein
LTRRLPAYDTSQAATEHAAQTAAAMLKSISWQSINLKAA